MIKEGIININKPAGMTSHDVVYAVRKLTGIKRVGHTGTLDPNATGVLPICIGHATRIADYTETDLKVYRCTMQLGLVTTTQDIWGEVLRDDREKLGEFDISREKLEAALASQIGNIDQYPPKYSSVRYAGKHLYEYAREGKEIEIKPRRVYIGSIEINDFDKEAGTAVFTVTCGKGTYVRAICNDTGELLGCGGCMTALTREASGAFNLGNSVELSVIKAMTRKNYDPSGYEDEINDIILDADFSLGAFGKVVIKTVERSRWFVNGGHIRFSECETVREPAYAKEDPPFEIRPEYKAAYAVYGHISEEHEAEEPTFLGVAVYSTRYKKLVADKIFRTIDENI